MSDPVIVCPHCKREIPLTEAISHQIRAQLRKEYDEETDKKLKLERERIENEVRRQTEQTVEVEVRDLREQVEEQKKKLVKAEAFELELRKKSRELEESKRAFELEMTRKLDEERQGIRDEAAKKFADEHKFKDLEKEKQISDLRQQIDELKRKAEQGSQQLQGEVLELELEALLKANFPHDQIEPVPKGVRGADVVQRVYNESGQPCGSIIWESKRTKAWSDGWIPKLKEDQRDVKADIAAIVSAVLPKEVSTIACLSGVWVTNDASVLGLTIALRMCLIQVAMAKTASVGKQEKMELLFGYLCGPEFRQKVEGIVEAFVSMKKDLDQEKRAMAKIWSRREKQIEQVVSNTARMYGEMQGIIGASLPEIKSLELKAEDSGEETGELIEDRSNAHP